MKKLRWGLIGCGGIARSAHIPAMVSLRDRVDLVATSDLSLKSAEEAAMPWGAEAYSDFRALLNRNDVDAVMIATPEFAHYEQVLAAAAAGKHILIEKPMANSLLEADEMLAACKAAGVRFMVGHSRRFTERYRAVRRAIDSGEIGPVRLVRENERRSAGGYWAAGHWSSNPALSRGVAMSNAIHEVDILRWFTGSEPTEVFAETNATVGARAVPDFMSCTIRFAGGAMGSTEIVPSMPPGYPNFHELEVYGANGMVRANDQEAQSYMLYSGDAVRMPQSRSNLLHNATAYAREHAAFVDAVMLDHALPMEPEEARWAVEVALAADESARTGQVIRLPYAGDQ